MIYIDTSVVLSRVFAEKRQPSPKFWSQPFVSSRLLEYEVFNRAHVHSSGVVDFQATRDLVDGILLIDLSPAALARALDPFPVQVRTLDGLHLATMVFLRSRAQTVSLATYDKRFADAAVALGFGLAEVEG